ncbi:hypothetical protein BT96DRAFT_619519 [Gymnopus androsaceus JB14]|uniref:Uncharacterized protein n=1 Tax=Gymnopus androsaceus JB14 TaxID=1447944 RepID=A0A6A4HVK0_9AGAR|nr:hypothetical protein BT96DRAFT_619519 [Gymnopus androsaceus JB14]
MNSRHKTLVRRVLSGDQSSNQALRELCLEAKTLRGSERFALISPAFLHFFSHRKPPTLQEKPPNLLPLSEERLALDTFRAILAMFDIFLNVGDPPRQIRQIMSSFTETIPHFITWASYLVEAFVENDLLTVRLLGDSSLHTLSIVSELLLAIIFATEQEIHAIKGVGNLIFRVFIYGLLVEPHSSSSLEKLDEITLSGVNLIGKMSENWEEFCTGAPDSFWPAESLASSLWKSCFIAGPPCRVHPTSHAA